MNELIEAVPYLGKRNPRLTKWLIIILALVAPLIAAYFGRSWMRILDFALLYMMLALGLNLVVGFAGLLDLGYIAFYAVGAYTWAFLASPHFGVHMPFWIVLPLGAAFAALAGIILGFPVLRLRGDYLAIVTLGFGEIVRIFMNNLNHPVNITNGPQGINALDSLNLFGWNLSQSLTIGDFKIHYLYLYYYFFLLCVIGSIVFIKRLQISRVGRAWAAMRDDELAAKAIGINVRNMKLLAFSLGATFGGVAGGLFGSFQGFVSPESFSLMESIAVLTMVVFGGMGNIAGAIVGALALTALPEILRNIALPVQEALFGTVILDPEVLRMLLLSLAMILMMLLRPAGLVPAHARYSRPELLKGGA
ncbi:ABC transporter permease subunit [Denitromonas ohlonensis]|jgi:branched-chain amino acid transport system permease protein|uniref:ABC transporter ATP-binding protein n=2 Tax=Denitromonas TaxID=139331 RepID=A0A557RR33_9RHOO|nr:ABC transporter ATP-binding protein [Denitromonas ohlonensis]TVT46073.1 MAG: ABC transporter ATP-binding protein [Denitromonas halophila]TVO67623.1 ABC transporter ATP-binding protein [Denitromonas ohlonensis]TVO76481.1 ABC transporter ATP-binding protein [Denitromonas ohlonensis]TVT70720.1 MAG: ABC transporter ATP-binding protein [Denitromonas halophila]TVT74217.1 MAG: ABC transporter ATP-binding protein [Denitromonas halophila]